LQKVGTRAARAFGHPLLNGPDGADGDVHVDVRRSVERVQGERVLAGTMLRRLVRVDQILVLLGGDHRDVAIPREGVDELRVRVDVQPLHVFALYVRVARRPENIEEARLVDLAADDLRGEDDSGEDLGELARRRRELTLLLGNELVAGHPVPNGHRTSEPGDGSSS
jgi:hypothetical protein